MNYLDKKSFAVALLLCASPLYADRVDFQTTAKVGDTLQIECNDLVATLHWGDGTEEKLEFHQGPQKLVVKSDRFSLRTSQNIDMLDCSRCGLSDLQLLDVVNLKTLYCYGNELTELNVRAVPYLVDLDCADNRLAALTLSGNGDLYRVNCSDNHLKKLALGQLADLEHLMCGNNELTTLSLFQNTRLKTLWCQGNVLEQLTLSEKVNPYQICAYDNHLKQVDMSTQQQLRDLWLDHNQLTSLDVSGNELWRLSLSNNQLTSISFGDRKHESLQYFYADNNTLMINSLPTIFDHDQSTMADYCIQPQGDFPLTSPINIGDPVDLTDYVRRNGFGKLARASVTWKSADGRTLERNVDYHLVNNAYEFLKSFEGVYAEVDSKYYPDVVFKTSVVQVIDPTGVQSLPEEEGYELELLRGGIRVTNAAQISMTIYDLKGAEVVNEQLNRGTHQWSLPQGIYLVNGKKVVISL